MTEFTDERDILSKVYKYDEFLKIMSLQSILKIQNHLL